MSTDPSAPDLVVVDAHVHVHDCHPLAALLDGAYENLAVAARAAGATGAAWHAVLLLTEAEPDDWFGRLDAAARAPGAMVPGAGPWAFSLAQEPGALVARAPGRTLRIVAGRQVACAEDLEVLALCTTERFPDGRPIDETLARVRALGALAAIPWGPGKWLGARGRLLSRIIAAAAPGELFLGDESSRPFFWGTPRHFGEALARGLAVLPGTDPLPFPHEGTRAGSFGFWTHMAFDPERPVTSLKAYLRRPGITVHAFGRLEGPVRFVRNQVAMQLRKRRRRHAA